MHLDEYVAQVADALRSTAALGDEQTQKVANALADAATAPIRLALLHALSAATAEITSMLFAAGVPGGPAVTAHLEGRDVRFRVVVADEQPEQAVQDEEATARISLRLPESLKSEIEQAAERDGVSVNTWLIRAARAALAHRGHGWGPPWSGPPWASARRITGWVNG
ncbi:MAG: toxin-antitoxin system HicB family antitoxin [Acidothermus sp.]|nr:toxin-antitoxin system HicB family antitoxin [Acidothermus sp.]